MLYKPNKTKNNKQNSKLKTWLSGICNAALIPNPDNHRDYGFTMKFYKVHFTQLSVVKKYLDNCKLSGVSSGITNAAQHGF